MSSIDCPLCGASQNHFFFRDKRRDYWRCEVCALVFVLPEFFLDTESEKQQYDLHENSAGDEGYRQFLGRLAEPLLTHLKPAATGLDFGCGPAPVLANMLSDAGHRVALYDCFYVRDESVWQQKYDFVTATEVVEHLHAPQLELARLWQVLNPGGCLALMTKLVIGVEAFSRWHYKNDPTHVCFFSKTTFEWWAKKHAAEITFVGSDVILLRKQAVA